MQAIIDIVELMVEDILKDTSWTNSEPSSVKQYIHKNKYLKYMSFEATFRTEKTLDTNIGNVHLNIYINTNYT